MASTGLVLLQLLLLVSLVSASHFFGGSSTFTYKGKNPDGTFQVVVRNRATIDGCGTLSWGCASGNCGSITKTQNYVTDKSTNSPQSTSQWCETETVETRKVTSDRPFEMRASSCCWINTRNSVNNWRLNTLVDLGIRSDTREPNRSPDITILPFMRVPENCPRTYKLTSYDPDGDRVQCRYGSIANVECDQCVTPAGFHLDQNSCTLHYQSVAANLKAFGFEMVIEDFSRGNINLFYSDGSKSYKHPLLARRKREAPESAPQNAATVHPITRQQYANTPALSKLPLHFSLLVDPAAPSCQEGTYLPKFVHPTSENGAHITAEVNKELEIRIRAQATHSVIKDLIISGPTNVTKHKTTHDEFVIRWTPVPEDFGDHFPVCFAVESAAGSSIYQSEMRCVVVDVGKEQIEAKVTCSETTMTVEIDKSSFYGLQPDHVRLSDPTDTACSLERYSNSTHIVGVIPLNACGTQIEEDDDNLYFKNVITTVEEDEVLITRRHLVEARFYCQYPKKGNVTLGFTAHRKNVTVWERGFGTFTYQFEFYPDLQFRTMIDPNSYPLEYDIGSRIYMQIDASSSINNTVMFVDSCRAAPYDNPNYQPTYSIIENGCTMDPTVQIHAPSEDNQFRFSMEAFKFIGLHDQVYISCSVMMCEAGNPNTRCSQGCVNSTWSGGHMHYHRKREAVIQSGEHFVSQGPLRLKRAADARIGGSDISLNLNLVFIAGCLLAAVGMVCGVVLYKTKTSRVKYQPLPSYES
ncbi:uncharacterized protein LOC121641155 [Melanotaenia boesemani]|uniref:uncharacterized protein LOC121641155 n=1 Tax=Melanotaenia boesemani TaxID=1250792 RepID=UPI001C03DE9D|nr:uncharacterized protein LOC121641155 [Melanotaenia boesemani]